MIFLQPSFEVNRQVVAAIVSAAPDRKIDSDIATSSKELNNAGDYSSKSIRTNAAFSDGVRDSP
jgi:hypothetical protein